MRKNVTALRRCWADEELLVLEKDGYWRRGCFHIPVGCQVPSLPAQSRCKWTDAPNLTWRLRGRIRIFEPPFKESSASDRWLGVEPDFRSDTSAKMQGGSTGFRFLLVMAAIRFGYGCEG